MAYKHGVYGEQVPFSGSIPLSAMGTIPAYIGTAPIHKLNTSGSADFDYTPYINKPILIEKYKDAETKLGYSSDWANMTLGEVISAHFLGDTSVSPIICINMANPKKLASMPTEKEVTLSGAAGDKTGYIDDSLAAIENITLGELTSGDYTMSYEDEKIKIHITKEEFEDGTITASYKQIDVTQATLNGAVFDEALNALDICEAVLNKIPNIIAAPGWSHVPDYHTRMIQKANTRLAEKWYTIVVSDIPSDSSVNTPQLAKQWKAENFYNSKLDKVCWPMATYAGAKYHLSTLACADMQTIDTNNDGVPYVSPSNKAISADSMILDDGTEIYLSEVVANNLNSVGITTMNIIRGQIRLWGSHMANYDYETETNILPEDRQDAGIRVGLYMLNYLQYNYLDNIDRPFAKRDIDAILASVQQWLNSMVNAGQLLYGTITFEESENSVNDMVSGDFVFNIKDTTTPNAKSLTFKMEYVTDGLSVLTGGSSS